MFCVISVAWFAELWVFNAEGGLCKTSHCTKSATGSGAWSLYTKLPQVSNYISFVLRFLKSNPFMGH
jgi:hypothetical protein